ncbi:MAG: hypothetical protein HY914_15010 [Desulfomonile tiedjei]|nr:hypothetical protein [Desulfomonile tiedjei]
MGSLTDLINSAQAILDSGFDLQTFLSWKTMALLSLLSVLGPFHYYTQHFRWIAAEQNARGLLAGEGILLAAQQEILKHPSLLVAHQKPNAKPV